MSFKKWTRDRPNVERIGKTAIFYLPSNKLNDGTRKMLHDFFVGKYNAYTHESSDIKGYWVSGGELIRDEHERYEISLMGKENFMALVDFLAELAQAVEEDSIYLAIGEESYLISPPKVPRKDT
jgi:hypothetical protein